MAGASQLTDRLVLLPETAETMGVAGALGGSSTSVTLIVTLAAAVDVPSEAVTVTV